MEIYDITSFKCSKLITQHYSTSFSLGIRTLDKKFRDPIYGIYGFVRYADEIVDTFHEQDKKTLLDNFRMETFEAIDRKLSMNPILHSFQIVVNKFKIDFELIDAFLKSMEMDLYYKDYSSVKIDEYIYGSAEVVGLMCLKVFCDGDQKKYEELKEPARKLGSAFQKVNFLRDMKSDYKERGRNYFPGVDFSFFNNEKKSEIEESIREDFREALKGIKMLPGGAKFGVYLAYIYYLKLFRKIQQLPASRVMNERIRISDNTKFTILLKTYLKSRLNMI